MELGEDWSAGEVDFVFTDELGRALIPNRVRRVFQAEAARLGLHQIDPHGLHHSLGSTAMRDGVPAKIVADRLGHASVSFTLDRYARVSDEDRRTAADLGAKMAGA